MNRNNLHVAIMAGGVGTRFWPSSRESNPKQFLDILGTGQSLLRSTFERFLPLVPAERIWVLTNSQYKEQVKQQIPEISNDQILCEPSRNNTAPCIAYIALKIRSIDPTAVFVVAPSDHIVLQEEEFRDNIKQAADFAQENEAIVTLGISPSRPDTGYGYIQFNAVPDKNIFKVLQFTEKPSLEKAESFLTEGNYLWNAGIFIWSTKTLINSFEKYAPEILEKLYPIVPYLNSSQEQNSVNEFYPQTPNISIDYAILEKSESVYTIPSDFGWSDLGTWKSLFEEAKKTEENNLVQAEYQILIDTKNTLIRVPNGKLVIAAGLEDYIVVDEGDVLMIYPKSKEQEIKKLTQIVKEEFGEKYN
jgi:mannose-1-phosphate guanylyltransferase